MKRSQPHEFSLSSANEIGSGFKAHDRVPYQPYIDGLRAFAVLAVALFHYFPAALPGGFVGVDIFFVISGYLISGIIFAEQKAGTFRFTTFYARRIRRLFPALIFILIVCVALGWVICFGDEFRQLGKHTASAALFISNFVLWHEAGYFDTNSKLKPLLHLWSLAVEEQFYILWPLLLFVAQKARLRPGYVILAVGIASFFFNLALWSHDKTADFYAPQARFWELMLGALAFSLNRAAGIEASAVKSNATAIAGTSACVVAMAAFNESTPFPGPYALLPTVGAAFIIMAGEKAWLNRTILSNCVFVFIGLISYPLYLWHWPLLSFERIAQAGPPNIYMRLSTLGASFVLAWATYRLVERPIRSLQVREHTNRLSILIGLSLCTALAVLGLVAKNAGIVPPHEKLLAPFKAYDNLGHGQLQFDYFGPQGCFLLFNGDLPTSYANAFDADAFDRNGCLQNTFPGRPTVFLIGDSHAAYLSKAFRPILEERKLNVGVFTAANCTPFSLRDRRPRCVGINEYIDRKIREIRPDTVVVFMHYADHAGAARHWYDGERSDYENFIAEKMSEIKATGVRHIILVGQMPTWQDSLAKVLVRNFVLNHQPIPLRTWIGVVPNSIAMDQKLHSLKYVKGVDYVSLKEALCDGNGCLTHVGADLSTDLLVVDYGHLSLSGAAYVTRTILFPYLDR